MGHVTEGEVVLTRDLSSGVVHKRVLMPDGGLMALEACNTDDAGEYAIVVEADLGEADVRCRRCLPHVVGVAESYTAVAQPAEDRMTLERNS